MIQSGRFRKSNEKKKKNSCFMAANKPLPSPFTKQQNSKPQMTEGEKS